MLSTEGAWSEGLVQKLGAARLRFYNRVAQRRNRFDGKRMCQVAAETSKFLY